MRISDWSSDVCSSDLNRRARRSRPAFPYSRQGGGCAPASGCHKRGRESRRQGRVRRPSRRARSGGKARTCRVAAGRRPTARDASADRRGRTPRPWPMRNGGGRKSEEHTSELQSLMRISYAVFCLKKNTHKKTTTKDNYTT